MLNLIEFSIFITAIICNLLSYKNRRCETCHVLYNKVVHSSVNTQRFVSSRCCSQFIESYLHFIASRSIPFPHQNPCYSCDAGKC